MHFFKETSKFGLRVAVLNFYDFWGSWGSNPQPFKLQTNTLTLWPRFLRLNCSDIVLNLLHFESRNYMLSWRILQTIIFTFCWSICVFWEPEQRVFFDLKVFVSNSCHYHNTLSLFQQFFSFSLFFTLCHSFSLLLTLFNSFSLFLPLSTSI